MAICTEEGLSDEMSFISLALGILQFSVAQRGYITAVPFLSIEKILYDKFYN